MTISSPIPTAPPRWRVPRRIWVGLVAAAVYVAIAAGGGNLVDVFLAPDADPVLELALSHLLPLPIAIAAGLVFAWRAGWWADVWGQTPVWRARPRRWWMWAVPALVVVQIVALFARSPWADLTAAYIVVGLISYLLVGVGEELFFRGILLQAVRAHHGETVTLLVTAIAFGVAHTLGALIAGADAAVIVFEVAVTAMQGVVFYAALRVTGTLWVPILLHGLGDFGRWTAAGSTIDTPGTADGVTETLLALFSVAVLVSVLLEDRRARRVRRATATTRSASPAAKETTHD